MSLEQTYKLRYGSRTIIDVVAKTYDNTKKTYLMLVIGLNTGKCISNTTVPYQICIMSFLSTDELTVQAPKVMFIIFVLESYDKTWNSRCSFLLPRGNNKDKTSPSQNVPELVKWPKRPLAQTRQGIQSGVNILVCWFLFFLFFGGGNTFSYRSL